MLRVGSAEWLYYYYNNKETQSRSETINNVIAELRRLKTRGEDINECQFDVYNRYHLDPESLTVNEVRYIKNAVER